MELILASSSARRNELMKLIGYEYRVVASHADENITFTSPGEYVERLAEIKADAVLSDNPGACVIGSDTIVWIDGRAVGKPSDPSEAYSMLKALSGRSHEVYTGAAILCGHKKRVFHDVATVTFNKLDDPEILSYIAAGESLDKAGAYGIQGIGSIFIEKIDGCYFTVMGLPTSMLYKALSEFGILPKWMA